MTKKLKIVVLGTRGFPGVQGGIETHCQNLYPLLTERNCEITVFARKPYLSLGLPHFYKGVKIIPLPCLKNKFLEAFLHTLRGIFAAKKIHPDILHIHAIGPSMLIPLARLLGLRVVMTHHGPDYQRKKWGRAAKIILRLGEYLGIRYAHKVIAISKDIADEIEIKYKRKVNVVPNGVLPPCLCATEESIKKFRLEKQKFILSVGRFVPEKGFLDLIMAFNNLQSEWKLVIAGCADHKNRYSMALEKEAGKSQNIILTGYLSGKPLQELYALAGLFVLPSYYEGLPIALLEAMSYGLPCLASDIEPHRSAGLKKERLFKPGDIAELSRKINRLITQPLSHEERALQMDTIAKNYDWNKIADSTREIYNGKNNHSIN